MPKVARTLRVPRLTRPVGLMQLTSCLRYLGVRKRRNPFNLKGDLGFAPRRPEHRNYHRMYDEAKTCWMKGVKRLHPDRGGNAKQCAQWNAVWLRAKILFKRLGVE